MTLYPPIHVCQFVLQWLAAGTAALNLDRILEAPVR